MLISVANYARYLIRCDEGKHQLQIPIDANHYYLHWVQKTNLAGHEVLVLCDSDGCDAQAYVVNNHVTMLNPDYEMGYLNILAKYLFSSLQYSRAFRADLRRGLLELSEDHFSRISPRWEDFKKIPVSVVEKGGDED